MNHFIKRAYDAGADALKAGVPANVSPWRQQMSEGLLHGRAFGG